MLKEIPVSELRIDPFHDIGTNWMLITAGNGKTAPVNAMTASWGGIGVMWGAPAAFVFVRESRYTKTLIESERGFSLCFPDHKKYAKELAFMGKASGCDCDKLAECSFTAEYYGEVPYVAESDTVLICRKQCAQPVEESSIVIPDVITKWYPDRNMHVMYIAEIEAALIRA